MEDHAQVRADILKAEVESLLHQSRKATERVHAPPDDQRPMITLKELFHHRMLRQWYRFVRKPAALDDFINIQNEGGCPSLSPADYSQLSALR